MNICYVFIQSNSRSTYSTIWSIVSVMFDWSLGLCIGFGGSWVYKTPYFHERERCKQTRMGRNLCSYGETQWKKGPATSRHEGEVRRQRKALDGVRRTHQRARTRETFWVEQMACALHVMLTLNGRWKVYQHQLTFWVSSGNVVLIRFLNFSIIVKAKLLHSLPVWKCCYMGIERPWKFKH